MTKKECAKQTAVIINRGGTAIVWKVRGRWHSEAYTDVKQMCLPFSMYGLEKLVLLKPEDCGGHMDVKDFLEMFETAKGFTIEDYFDYTD